VGTIRSRLITAVLLAAVQAQPSFGAPAANPAPAPIAPMVDPKVLAEARRALKAKLEVRRWSLFAGFGVNSFGSSRYILSNANSNTTSTDTSSLKVTGNAGVSYLFNPYFQLAGELEYAGYSYSTGGGSDSDLLVMVVPRGQFKSRAWTVWAGAGAGLAVIHMSDSLAANPPGAGFSGSASGFAFSPEMGLDYDFNKTFFAGAQISYVFTAATTDTNESLNRRWASLTLRCGTRF
jgi:hypothetical protein